MKGNVILDLDETLISAEPVEEYDFKKNKGREKKFKKHDMDGYYIVFERPGVQEFLDYLFNNFNVSVWTAASKDYAVFVVNKVLLSKPGRKLNYLLFSYHGDISKKSGKGPKDIKALSEVFKLPEFTLKNTFIIDDLDKVCKGQEGNCIRAKEFKFSDEGSEKDDFLPRIQKEVENVKSAIDSGKDIAKIIKEIK